MRLSQYVMLVICLSIVFYMLGYSSIAISFLSTTNNGTSTVDIMPKDNGTTCGIDASDFSIIDSHGNAHVPGSTFFSCLTANANDTSNRNMLGLIIILLSCAVGVFLVLMSGFASMYLIPIILFVGLLLLNLFIFPINLIFDTNTPIVIKAIVFALFNAITVLAMLDFWRGGA